MTYAQDKAPSVKLLALEVDGVSSTSRVYCSDTGGAVREADEKVLGATAKLANFELEFS